jgi:hypothetical protein
MKKECSFKQWVSVYYDGEMDLPYKEKMEKHIAGCADCERQLDAYKKISTLLAPLGASEDVQMKEAQQRVLQKLETIRPYSGYAAGPVFTRPIWKRRVSIPVPAAAAAVFIIIALAFLWARSPGRTQTQNMAITAETEIIPDFLPVSGMESVLQYLSSNDSGDIIILKLPESRNFASYGEPAIIKAADYQRNVTTRRKNQHE